MAFQKKTIIKKLTELNDNWNDMFWLFSADGTLHLMRYGKNGEQVMHKDTGGVDESYTIKSFRNIKTDGGDW